MDEPPRNEGEPEGPERVTITRGELAAFLLQSVMLAAAMAFTAAIFQQRVLHVPRSVASGVGLLIGMLCSYPTIRILGRADGVQFSFLKWFAISLSAAAFATAAIGVF